MLEELREANNYLRERMSAIPHKSKFSEKLAILESEALAEGIPIVSPEVREYLRFLLRDSRITNVLEIGTATGYSGIVMAEEIEKRQGILCTIEKDPEKYERAAQNFRDCDLTNIKALRGDALDLLPGIPERFDFLFVDAAKSRYMDIFKACYGLLNPEALVVIDNLLFRGYLYREYPKRYKGIVTKLEAFIGALYGGGDDFVLLPFGDGVGLLRKHGDTD
ncbi:MAG: O-methyltransferase [Fusobacteriaceae bacterium]|jgi:caffeoyl-CoA O-methyltransferase|nr:O-methyltransferase [Fusobacteriaceae bacterium]